jgi:hypothetical protein
MKIFVAIALLVITSCGSFLFGWWVSKHGFSNEAESVQAEINFGHLETYKDLKSDFLGHCAQRLEARLDHAIDTQKMLIAEHLRNAGDKRLRDYIKLRDEKLLVELQTYDINWTKEWVLPDCPGS